MYTFRFDDISANSDMENAIAIAQVLERRFRFCKILFCVSVLYDDVRDYPDDKQEWVFEPKKKAQSDIRNFYRPDGFAIPVFPTWIQTGSHGLVHVDHRLLDRGAQELSILVSCSLLRCDVFAPPFNWWNVDTEAICRENGIRLLKFEDGWLSMECNEFNAQHHLWYLHSRNRTPEQIREWLK